MNDRETGETLLQLQELIRQQYALNAGTTLPEIRTGDGSSYTIHSQVLTFCRDQREAVLHILRGEIAAASAAAPEGPHLVPLFVTSTAAHIYRNNQFITLSAGDEATLAALYLEYLSDLAAILAQAPDVEAIGRRLWATQLKHLGALRAFILELDRRHSRQGESLLDRTAVCAEYTAQLQLGILGIEEKDLLEPILDVGCGRSVGLVTCLRGLGLEAYGIDRLPPSAGYCLQVDWLQFEFRASCWGTIVSHMAFSNHFRFHHLYRQGTPEAYARKYMEALAGLRVGGSLYYAPGLPFIEPLLPAARYRVQTRGLALAQTAMGAQALQPDEAGYATRITRIA